METADAVTILSALGQPTRLDTFRLLVRTGTQGMAASDIAGEMGVPRNTMSAHLSILARAGLVESERAGTRIFYRPSFRRLAGLTSFLMEGCCGGREELCEPMLTEITTLRSKQVER
ncbi:MAG: metalloregulator ArsR/SmtB family transcription factor [Sphingobium sp.]